MKEMLWTRVIRLEIFPCPSGITPALRQAAVEDIACAPGKLRAAVAGLTDSQLETPYREGGWTVRQVVHHVADSHINAYIRLRLGLTETEPPIKAYQEADWARLEDAQHAPVENFAQASRAAARALGPSAADRDARTIRPAGAAFRVRPKKCGMVAVLVCVAWPAPHRAHHGTA